MSISMIHLLMLIVVIVTLAQLFRGFLDDVVHEDLADIRKKREMLRCDEVDNTTSMYDDPPINKLVDPA